MFVYVVVDRSHNMCVHEEGDAHCVFCSLNTRLDPKALYDECRKSNLN